MQSSIDIVFAIFFALVFLVFVYFTRRTSTFRNFAVSDNSIGLFLIFISFSATFIGPGFSMALVNQGFTTGFFYFFLAGFYAIAKIIEGRILAPIIRTRFANSLSIGEIIAGKDSHNKKILHVFVGLISFGLVIGFSTVLSKAGGEVINSLFGISRPAAIIIMTGIIMIYAFFGGIKATILTDVFQFILFVVLIFILLIAALIAAPDLKALTSTASELTVNSFTHHGFIYAFGLIVTWLFGEMLIPPTINRILSTKSAAASKKGLIFSGLFMLLWLFIMLWLGVISKILLPEAEGSEQLLIVLAEQHLKFGLFGIFTIAVIGIVMSSQDSLINSASVIFTNDIFNVFVPLSDKKKLILARISTLIVGLFSMFFALFLPSILEGLLLIYSLWAPAILIPLFASLFLKRPSWFAALASMIAGIITSLVWRHFAIADFFPTILAGIILSASVYFIIYSIERTTWFR